MRYISKWVAVAVLVMTGFAFAQNKVNFAGNWTLDAAKSQLGEGGGRRFGPATKMVVAQEENKLSVESFRTNRDGEEVSTTYTYTLDGKKCENGTENRKMVSTVTWAQDGQSLTIASTSTFSREGQEFTMESTEKWSMSEGTLVLDATRTTPSGERTTKAVYQKAAK